MIMLYTRSNVCANIMKRKCMCRMCRKTYTKICLSRKKKCRYLSHVKCVDLLLKVLEQNNATKVPRLLYLGWMYSLWPIMKGPAYCCASTQQHWWPTLTHTLTHTNTGQAAARLSSPKIIRHQNEFPCFFSLPLFILFMWWNSGDWLMQLTCSHHEFSLHHYMGTLQEQESCDYRDAISMHKLTETHRNPRHTLTHAFIQMNERIHYSVFLCFAVCLIYVAFWNTTALHYW